MLWPTYINPLVTGCIAGCAAGGGADCTMALTQCREGEAFMSTSTVGVTYDSAAEQLTVRLRVANEHLSSVKEIKIVLEVL